MASSSSLQLFGLLALLVLISSCCAAAAVGTPDVALTSYVDTTIGTGGAGFGIGSLNPGPQVPFGAMRLGPDTSFGHLFIPFNHFGGYYYTDTDIVAFSHTHLVGAGVGDWGNVGVMPVRSVSSHVISSNNYMSTFSHSTETATAGYYAVELETHNVMAELTVSGTLSGIHRYTFHNSSQGDDNIILVDVCHTISQGACKNASVTVEASPDVAGATAVYGSVKTHGSLTGRAPSGGVTVYFYAIVEDSTDSGLWEAGKMQPTGTKSLTSESGSLGAYVEANNSVVQLRIGISFISAPSARANLLAQQAATGSGAAAESLVSFDDARAQTTAAWEAMLSRVAISDSTATKDDMTMFYSALYRSLLAPTAYTEATDRQYLGFDNKVHSWSGPGDYHSDMSLWDIHRSQTPWLVLVAPERARDTTNSLVTMFQQGGKLPRWPLANVYTGCMVGSHAVVVMADMLVKGVAGINGSAILQAATAAVSSQDQGDSYAKLGYVPSEDFGQSASLTLAYAFDDWAASQICKQQGNMGCFSMFYNRSKSYRNVWNSTENLFCPRDASGAFACPKDPTLPYPFEKDYTESDGEQYRWFVPGDPTGLVELYPSVGDYIGLLDEFFAKSRSWVFKTTLPNPYYWAGNEPDLLTPWQFNFAGNDFANYTQYWTRAMLNERYNVNPNGVPGNDDFGTMSAWECWAYLGLYPISGSTKYSIGSPRFEQVTIALPASSMAVVKPTLDTSASSNNDASTVLLTIIAHNASPTNMFVQNATVNGKALPTPFVEHGDLVAGGDNGATLEFWMGHLPAAWGAGAGEAGEAAEEV